MLGGPSAGASRAACTPPNLIPYAIIALMPAFDAKTEAARLFEIEAVLMTIPGVRAGVAVPLGKRGQARTFGVYVIVRTGIHLSADHVLEACHQHLGNTPSPSLVVFGKDLPLLPDGEIDRAALKSRFA